jgi:hypothetical protein
MRPLGASIDHGVDDRVESPTFRGVARVEKHIINARIPFSEPLSWPLSDPPDVHPMVPQPSCRAVSRGCFEN